MHLAITKNNSLTIHHIQEVACGGSTTLDNAALLGKKYHRILNMLESRDYGLYFAWNDLFRDINVAKRPPSDEYVKEMIDLKTRTKKIIYK